MTIHTAKPGIVIGRGGKDVEAIKKQIETMTGKTCSLNIVEVNEPRYLRTAGCREHRAAAGKARYLSAAP